MTKNVSESKDEAENPKEIRKFKRVLPQVFAAMAKNLIVVNKALFDGFPSIVLPSLLGKSPQLNPDETLLISPSQASTLSSLAYIAHPLGGIVGGKVCDVIGRRKAMMLITPPIFITFFTLGFAQSYELICVGFALLGFIFGLKEAPTITYVAEICEPSIRGTLMAIGPLASSIGLFILYLLGSILSWRHVSLICAVVPIVILVAVFLVPESPIWLLSKGRPEDVQKSIKSLAWLRGWVSLSSVQKEFSELQSYSEISNACASCAKQSIKCNHPKPTFFDKIKEFKRKRSLKPFILIVCLQFFVEFSGFMVWMPYIIPIIEAQGIPIQANVTTVILSGLGFVAHICLLLTVHKFGKRNICLRSTLIVVLCCFALSIYGFVFFPLGWSSFNHHTNPIEIQKMVGNYGYLALILVCLMQMCTKMGVGGVTLLLVGEVFPLKVRSFLSGIAVGCRYIFASIATKTYYEIETWFSLPGAILFYGIISFIGLIVMYIILPETENRTLADIELHYSDNKKPITDVSVKRQLFKINSLQNTLINFC